MQHASGWIGLKDVIFVTLLTALCVLICTLVVMPFSVNITLVLWVVSGIDAVLCGPICILMCAKAPRYGTQLLSSAIFAVYYYFTNGMAPISLMVLTIGIVRELLMVRGGYRSPVRLTIAHALLFCGTMLAPVVLLFSAKAQMVETMLAGGLSQDYIDSVFSVYSFGNIGIGIGVTIIGAVCGCWVGYRMLRKHFVPAGIVEDR